jgi:hypothetical protein
MHFEIRRGYKTGRQLSTAQRTSGLFAEEPVVLGKVLRRGVKPLMVTEEQFKLFKPRLLLLMLAGAIEVDVIDGDKKSPYSEGMELKAPAPVVQEPKDKDPEDPTKDLKPSNQVGDTTSSEGKEATVSPPPSEVEDGSEEEEPEE